MNVRAVTTQPPLVALPILAHQEEIMRTIRTHQVVILGGETGSGKTTQLPQFCLQLGRGQQGLIGCTQPRRIAARSVAQRLAQELGCELGTLVGYQVRFHDRISPATRLKVMTDGIMLAEIQADRHLRRYDTIIIDEAHERSLNIDFMLGYLHRLLPHRPELKLIITSATLEAERFARHFRSAPVLEVSGRSYPVEIRWRPADTLSREQSREMDTAATHDPLKGKATTAPVPDNKSSGKEVTPQFRQQSLVAAVEELTRASGAQGDILVFLPGEREIREAAEVLRKRPNSAQPSEILPLFARQSLSEQARVFHPSGAPRIILATNVAETSLTVPGVRFVVDSGLARISRYSLRHKVSQLQVEKISQAAARQRAGRCGRVANGICIRLYGEADYGARPAWNTPEILRTSLAGVILRMCALKLGAVESFPFLDPPTPRAIEDGYQLLQELGALDAQRQLTSLGQQLTHLPVDPRIGRMLLAANTQDCLRELLIICAALSIQDPRLRPEAARENAASRHARHEDPHSDFMSWLKLWEFCTTAWQHRKSGRKLAQWCEEEFLSLHRLREWRDTHAQLHALMAESGYRVNGVNAPAAAIHRALLTGLLGQVGWRQVESDDYLGARAIRFRLHPGVRRSQRKLQWIMAGELLQTTQLYARQVAPIDPLWIEAMAGPLLRRSVFDPFWDSQGGQACAYERVTCYGLPIVPKRRIRLGPVDPVQARQLFITHALVRGEWRSQPPFLRHNQELIATIQELEHKGRRQDLLVDEAVQEHFYAALLPAEIWSGELFERWRRQAEAQQPRLLYLERDQLIRQGATQPEWERYPDHVSWEGYDYELSYRFEPHHPLDGLTITVPLILLGRIDSKRLDWLVPGLIREKLTFLLRGLPQRIRRHLVPLPTCVTDFLGYADTLRQPPPALLNALSEFIRRRCGQSVEIELWPTLPPHLCARVRLVDEKGEELASSRDWDALYCQWHPQARSQLRPEPESLPQLVNLTRWDFGDLPTARTLTRRGIAVTVYPALSFQGEQLQLEWSDDPLQARRLHCEGVRELARRHLHSELRQALRSLPVDPRPALNYARLEAYSVPHEGKAALKGQLEERWQRDLCNRALQELLPDEAAALYEAASFTTALATLRPSVVTTMQALLREWAPLLEQALALGQALGQPGQHASRTAIRQRLLRLLPSGCLATIPLARLPHYARYLKALALRLEKLGRDPDSDRVKQRQLDALEDPWREQLAQHRHDREWEQFGIMLEELHVSLFAEILKTPFPVSVKRLERAWQQLSPGAAGL